MRIYCDTVCCVLYLKYVRLETPSLDLLLFALQNKKKIFILLSITDNKFFLLLPFSRQTHFNLHVHFPSYPK